MNFVLHPQRRFSPRLSQTREQLRNLARAHNVPRGRDIIDTIHNLVKAGIKLN